MKHRLLLVVALCSVMFSAPAQAVRESNSADQAFKQGDYVKAINLYESMLASNPDNVRLLRFLGLSYLYTGNSDDAITTLTRAKQLAPSNASIRYYLAQGYYAAGENDLARQELTYIIAELPDGTYKEKARSLDEQLVRRPNPQAHRKPISLYQKVGYQYDSNVLLEPQKLGIHGKDKDSSRFYQLHMG